MPVYVDDMRASYGRMIMCHMIADTHDELIDMAIRIGVQTRWIQYPNTPREHFDISLSKRALAVKSGAIEITWRQCAAMSRRREVEGQFGEPEDAEKWLHEYYEARLIERSKRQ